MSTSSFEVLSAVDLLDETPAEEEALTQQQVEPPPQEVVVEPQSSPPPPPPPPPQEHRQTPLPQEDDLPPATKALGYIQNSVLGFFSATTATASAAVQVGTLSLGWQGCIH